ncbi:MAG: PIN domain-containing protein [Deltaproteobacteria bacterium]|nr:PIN domain-containing protein [Deltaproteobacteria bacterium]
MSTTMRRFLDTSTLVWLYDTSVPKKRDAARAVLATGDSLVVSTNVLGELFVALTKRRGTQPPLATVAQANERVRFAAEDLEVVSVHREDVLRALGYRVKQQISWWDALNWSTAVAARCEEYVGEDRASLPRVDGVRFVNPFA